MLRILILTGFVLIATGCSQTPDLNVTNDTEDAHQSISDLSSNQLVHVQGKFINIQLTGQRHQSYIFTFRVQDLLHGPWQAPTPIDELVRFELPNDFGGADLFAELLDQNPRGGMTKADAAIPVTNSQRYQLVLWRFQSFGRQQIDAQLVGLPVPVRK